jgi:hypothetical protein
VVLQFKTLSLLLIGADAANSMTVFMAGYVMAGHLSLELSYDLANSLNFSAITDLGLYQCIAYCYISATGASGSIDGSAHFGGTPLPLVLRWLFFHITSDEGCFPMTLKHMFYTIAITDLAKTGTALVFRLRD